MTYRIWQEVTVVDIYMLGPYKGKLLVDLEGLFRVVRLEPPYPEERALNSLVQKGGIPMLIFMGDRACLLGLEGQLCAPADPEWEDALLSKLRFQDPLSAAELAEEAVQFRVVAEGLRRLEFVRGELEAFEDYLDQKLTALRQSRQFSRLAEMALVMDKLQNAQGLLAKTLESLGRLLPLSYEVPMPSRKANATLGERVVRVRGKSATPKKVYRLPLLRAIRDLGGKCSVKEALDRVFEAVKSSLVERDLEYIVHGGKTKEPVWRNRARWEIRNLREEGLVHSESHGTLALTEKGYRYLEAYDETP